MLILHPEWKSVIMNYNMLYDKNLKTDRVTENTFKLSVLKITQYNNYYCTTINNIVNAVNYHVISTLF